MTNIEFRRKNGSITSFTVQGHSGYSHEGEDIVCASVSATIWMTVNGLENVLGLPVSYTERDGFVECSIPPLLCEERKKADVLLESLSDFFDNLIKQYGKFVTKTEV